MRDREEYRNNRAKTRNDFGKQKSNANSVAQKGSKRPVCAKCGRNHSCVCCEDSTVAPPDRVAQKGATFGTGGGTNRLYALNNGQDHESFPDLFMSMIQVFDFTVYAFLDPGENLSFVTPYVSMNFDIIP
ncbi:uncharacterized protein [Solanum lycopersicum]|uniref:uncharacterized protein n=1 Tax=Solanum lycopersicum TaxID=4081 RepID=UPI0037492EDC